MAFGLPYYGSTSCIGLSYSVGVARQPTTVLAKQHTSASVEHLTEVTSGPAGPALAADKPCQWQIAHRPKSVVHGEPQYPVLASSWHRPLGTRTLVHWHTYDAVNLWSGVGAVYLLRIILQD